jgi:membrane protease subunit HflK
MAWNPAAVRPPGRPTFSLPARWGHWLLLLVVGVLAIALLESSMYQVEPEEQAVVLRLGRLYGVEDPGFHFKLPFGLDEVHTLPTRRVLKEEFGFRTVKAGVRSEFQKGPYVQESLSLTGDLNIADVEWIVQYRISSATDFWFHLQEPEQAVRDLSEAVLREVVGSRTVDQVLTVGRQEIEIEALRLLQEALNKYRAGIKIVAVQLRNVTPPEPVQASFNDVNRAEQDRERLIDQAKAVYNREIPSAEGEAQRTVEQAEGLRQERINRAKGDASRFQQMLVAYKKSPDVTRKRLYLETMAQVIAAVDDLTIVDGKAGTQLLPLLQVKQDGQKAGESPAPAPAAAEVPAAQPQPEAP